MSGVESILVLTSAGGVDDSVAAAARAILLSKGGDVGASRRLACSAVEIAFFGVAPAASEIAAALAPAPVDCNIVPARGRRKSVLLADMDSTIIGVECIDELADFAGVKAEVAAITESAMRGELDFAGALIARIALLRGLEEAALQRCFDERVRLNPGARTLVRTMAALGAETALVSGGFTFFSQRVAAAAGFAINRANRLLTEDGRLTGEVGLPILGREAKLAMLEKIVAERALANQSVLAIGDGANDLDMVRAAGLGVAYRAKPALAAEADARLDHSDLTAALALQGVPESEWRS